MIHVVEEDRPFFRIKNTTQSFGIENSGNKGEMKRSDNKEISNMELSSKDAIINTF